MNDDAHLHRHKPTELLSQRFMGGASWVTYACDCGHVLPERRA